MTTICITALLAAISLMMKRWAHICTRIKPLGSLSRLLVWAMTPASPSSMRFLLPQGYTCSGAFGEISKSLNLSAMQRCLWLQLRCFLICGVATLLRSLRHCATPRSVAWLLLASSLILGCFFYFMPPGIALSTAKERPFFFIVRQSNLVYLAVIWGVLAVRGRDGHGAKAGG